MNESEIQEKIQIIMRQTDYSIEEARNQLEIHNFNIMKTISSFMNPKKKRTGNCQTKISKSRDLFTNKKLFG